MIIIGEKLNSTLKSIRPAMENYDEGAVADAAKKQSDAGADYLDVNAGMFYEDESERLEWLVNAVQRASATPLVLDSPNPAALERALRANRNPKPIINSLTGEKERFDAVMPLVTRFRTGIIALCMDDSGMPETVGDRLRIAGSLIERLSGEGVGPEDIYIDPMVRPIATGSHYGAVVLETIREVRAAYPGVHIVCGLSNISFGLPGRRLINQAFLVAAMAAGLDTAILDPLDERLMSFLYVTEALLGRDEYCMNYLSRYREGRIRT